MLEWNNGRPFIKVKDVMKIFGVGHKKAIELTEDLIPASKGTGKANRARLYFIDDVAKEIMRKGL